MSAHTPGPWKHVGKGLIATADESQVVGTFHSAKGTDNAPLVIAAPELLAALVELIAHRDELGLGDYPAITRARAALAKVSP